jgi:hypothetical protein
MVGYAVTKGKSSRRTTMDELQKIAHGLKPELIQFKSQEYHEEFEAFKADLLAQKRDTEWVEEDPDFEEAAFRSFVMHKIAAMDTVLSYIVAFLNGEIDE